MHPEVITVRGVDEPVVVEVRETRHGPLLDTFVSGALHPEYVALPEEPSYALSWVGLDHGTRPSLVLDVAQAGSFEAFRAAALEGLACPGQNVVYADVDGTTGYVHGRYPVRSEAMAPCPRPVDRRIPMGGPDTPDELPWGTDPERGYLVTANHRMHDEGVPPPDRT